MDLSRFSVAELDRLLRDVERERRRRVTQGAREARARILRELRAQGLSVQDVFGGGDAAPARRGPGRPKGSVNKGRGRRAGGRAAGGGFANPQDASQTWSGRGRRPGWFVAAVESGTDPESLRIKGGGARRAARGGRRGRGGRRRRG